MARRCLGHQSLERRLAESGVDREPDVRGLDRDAALEACALERFEQADVLGDRRFDLRLVVEMLAEERGGRAQPLRRERARGGHRVVERDAGDVAPRHPIDDRARDPGQARGDESVEHSQLREWCSPCAPPGYGVGAETARRRARGRGSSSGPAAPPRSARSRAQREARECGELVGVHPAVDRQVLAGGLQVLAEGEDLDAGVADVARAWSAPRRRPRPDPSMSPVLTRPPYSPRSRRARGARRAARGCARNSLPGRALAIEPRHGLHVVREHLGRAPRARRRARRARRGSRGSAPRPRCRGLRSCTAAITCGEVAGAAVRRGRRDRPR